MSDLMSDTLQGGSAEDDVKEALLSKDDAPPLDQEEIQPAGDEDDGIKVSLTDEEEDEEEEEPVDAEEILSAIDHTKRAVDGLTSSMSSAFAISATIGVAAVICLTTVAISTWREVRDLREAMWLFMVPVAMARAANITAM